MYDMITIFSLVRENIIEIAFWYDSVERSTSGPADDRDLILEFGSTHEKVDAWPRPKTHCMGRLPRKTIVRVFTAKGDADHVTKFFLAFIYCLL